jgi:type I restriction enzyme S subunit
MSKMVRKEKEALIPQLRFSEFRESEGWKVRPLGDVFRRLTTKNSENNENVLTISAQLGLVSQLEYFNKQVAAKDLSGYYLLHRGDFAYNKSYSKGYPMGAIKPLRMHEKGVVSTLYICFRAKKKVSGSFFEHYFESGLQNSEIEKIAKEGGRAHGLLNVGVKDFFEKINLFIPEEEEQQKIADCLSSLDALIKAQAEKIDALKTHQKGLMQQLFPRDGETIPQLRFPEFRDTGEWEAKNFGELVEVASGQVDRLSHHSVICHMLAVKISSHTRVTSKS